MNREYLLEQFGLLEEYLERARSISRRQEDEFLSDPILVDASVRQITVLFETSHNIAKHLIAELGWREAQSKAEAFEILAERDVLPAPLCDSLRQAARFRNLATYQTARLADKIVYEILTEHVADFEKFAAHVAHWLDEHATD